MLKHAGTFFLETGLITVLWRRHLLFFFALVCAFCLDPRTSMVALGAKYGTPLKFDAPPVDLDYNSKGAVTRSPAHTSPAPGVQTPAQARLTSGARSAATKQAAKNGIVSASASPGSAPVIRLFGTVEFRSPIKNLPKWERVRNAESALPPFFTAKALDANNQKVAERWAKIKADLKNQPLMEKAKGINQFFNQWPYKTDLEIWGVEDYWATPREFVQKSGDCEDYAISKYYALRELGVPASSLRIAAVKDTIRNIGHAVTIVFDGNNAYILDNLTNLVLSHSRLTHYAPLYTVNEEYLWRHIKPKSGPVQR